MGREHERRERRRMRAAAEAIVSHRALEDAGHTAVVQEALGVLRRELFEARSLDALGWLAADLDLRAALDALGARGTSLAHAASECAVALELAGPLESLPRRRARRRIEGLLRTSTSPWLAPAVAAVGLALVALAWALGSRSTEPLGLSLAAALVFVLATLALPGTAGPIASRLARPLLRALDRGWPVATHWPRWETALLTGSPAGARRRVERCLTRAVRDEEARRARRAREARGAHELASRLRGEMEVDDPGDAGGHAPEADDVLTSEAALLLLREPGRGRAFRADFLLAMAHRAAERFDDDEAVAVVRGCLRLLGQAGCPVTAAEHLTVARLASVHRGGLPRMRLLTGLTTLGERPAAPAPPAPPPPRASVPPAQAPSPPRTDPYSTGWDRAPRPGVRVAREPEQAPIWRAEDFLPPSGVRARGRRFA